MERESEVQMVLSSEVIHVLDDNKSAVLKSLWHINQWCFNGCLERNKFVNRRSMLLMSENHVECV